MLKGWNVDIGDIDICRNVNIDIDNVTNVAIELKVTLSISRLVAMRKVGKLRLSGMQKGCNVKGCNIDIDNVPNVTMQCHIVYIHIGYNAKSKTKRLFYVPFQTVYAALSESSPYYWVLPARGRMKCEAVLTDF